LLEAAPLLTKRRGVR